MLNSSWIFVNWVELNLTFCDSIWTWLDFLWLKLNLTWLLWLKLNLAWLFCDSSWIFVNRVELDFLWLNLKSTWLFLVKLNIIWLFRSPAIKREHEKAKMIRTSHQNRLKSPSQEKQNKPLQCEDAAGAIHIKKGKVVAKISQFSPIFLRVCLKIFIFSHLLPLLRHSLCCVLSPILFFVSKAFNKVR